jgi:hypothetical protein
MNESITDVATITFVVFFVLVSEWDSVGCDIGFFSLRVKAGGMVACAAKKTKAAAREQKRVRLDCVLDKDGTNDPSGSRRG